MLLFDEFASRMISHGTVGAHDVTHELIFLKMDGRRTRLVEDASTGNNNNS